MNLDKLELTNYEKQQLNDWSGFFEHQLTWSFAQFLNRPERVVCYFTGNRYGKTDDIATATVMSILGIHPVEYKNIRPDDNARVIRFCSEIVPNDPDGGEVKNTQYPAFKKRLPASLIKKDITMRNPSLIVRDPQGGKDIVVEFTSYNQTVQRQAGVPRKIVNLDESAPQSFYEEQLPRMIDADGHMNYSLTPAEQMNWEYDSLFERAKVYVRTQSVVDRMFQRFGKIVPRIETTDSNESIAVIQAATDDNPTLNSSIIDEIMSLLGATDEDLIDIRRYGLFKAVTGQIFKDLDLRTHRISEEKYFPDGIPHNWLHGRFIDYHEHNPWAIIFMSISPSDEVFVWREYNPSPEKMVTVEIARQLASMGGDYKFALNKIDPLAAKKQSNTGLSVIDDFNRAFFEFKRESVGTGGYWSSWDTKSTRGRDEIRKRLKNSRLVGKPFNNEIMQNGRIVRVPTLWIFDNCPQTIQSLRSWRKEEWSNRESLLTKDEKDKPQQKWSHFCMCLEAAFKEAGFRARNGEAFVKRPTPYYFTGRA